MREHIRVLGILNIILGSLTALVGLIALLAMGSIAGFLTATLSSASESDFHDHVVAAPIIATIGLVVAVFFFALGLPAILGGWGLLHFRPWSRLLMIVVSVFHLFHIPLGTALGVYGLWVLLSTEAQQLLQSGGALPLGAAATYHPTAYPGRSSFGPPPGTPPPV